MDVFRILSVCVCVFLNKDTNICWLIIKKSAKVFFAQISLSVPLTFTLFMRKSLRSIYKEELNCLRGRWFRNLSGRYGCLRQLEKLFSGHESKQNSELSFGSNKKTKGKNCFQHFYHSLYKVGKNLVAVF